MTTANGFSLDGPAAEVVLTVVAWRAKMERLAIADRIAAAGDHLAEDARPWGRAERQLHLPIDGEK